MCGISGVLNTTPLFNTKLCKFLADAAVANTVRGADSTGVLQQDRKGTTYVHKLPIPGPYFINDKMTAQFIRDADRCYATVFHNRAATQGKVTQQNAHPFHVSRDDGTVLVGVHNGSLVNWSSKPGASKFEVDSEWALNLIATKGIEAFADIQGPFCFVWTDSKRVGKIFMARNSGRPMHLRLSKDNKQLYFASEAGMLAWMTERNDIDTHPELLSLSVDTLYEFDMTGAEVKWTKTTFPKKEFASTNSNNTSTGTGVVVAGAASTPTTSSFTTTNPTNSTGAGAGTSDWGARRGATQEKLVLNKEAQDFIQNVKDASKGVLGKVTSTPAPNPSAVAKVAADIAAARKPTLDPNTMMEEGKPVELTAQRTDDAPDDDDGLTTQDKAPTDWYSERTASAIERGAAIQKGYFRELYWFEGLAYEDSTGELIGDVRVFDEEKKKHVTLSGIIRGLSSERANTNYVYRKTKGGIIGNWAVVIGWRVDKHLGETLVLSELTEKGRESMRRMDSDDMQTASVH